MGKALSQLPEGFVVDKEENLPPGFVIDKAPDSTIVSRLAAVSKQVPPTPVPEGFVSQSVDAVRRLARGTMSAIVPTNLEEAKRLVNPRAGQAGLSRVVEEEAARVGDAATKASQNIAEDISTSEFGRQFPKTAAVPGAALEAATEVAAPLLRPSAWQEALGAEAPGIGVGFARKALVDIGVRTEAAAASLARRVLGYTKRFFKQPEDIARANDVALEMLKQDVISSNAQDMMTKAEKLSDLAGKKIGKILTTLDEAGVRGVNPQELSQEIVTQLGKGKSRGAYAADDRILNEIVETVKAHGDQPLTFESAQALKKKLGDVASFDKMTDALRADYYQKAYGIVRQSIENMVSQAEPVVGAKGATLLREYLDAKGVYGKASEAVDALMNRVSSDLGNNLIGLRQTILAAQALAQNRVGTAAAIVAGEGGVKTATAMASKVAYSLGKYLKGLDPIKRPKALQAIVNAGILDEARNYYNVFERRGIRLPAPERPKPPEVNEALPLAGAPAPGSQKVAQAPGKKSLTPSQKAYVDGLQAWKDYNRTKSKEDYERLKSKWLEAFKSDPKNREAENGLRRLAMNEGRDPTYYTTERRT